MQLIVEANGTVSTMAQGFLVTYYKISSGVLIPSQGIPRCHEKYPNKKTRPTQA